MTDAEREARESAYDKAMGFEAVTNQASWDYIWAAASEWCRADQTRAILRALRAWRSDCNPHSPGWLTAQRLIDLIEAEFPSPEQSGQAPRRTGGDMSTDPTPTNWREAMDLALLWAEDKRSNLNILMGVEADPESRVQTLAAVVEADAAEVRKWAAIAEGFAAGEREPS